MRGFLDLENLPLNTALQVKIAHEIVHKKCKFLPIEQRTEAIEHLAVLLDVAVEQKIFLNSEKILAMFKAGMTIGAHTHKHPILSLEDEYVANFEIAESKHKLEEIINSEIKYFAYPNGRLNKDFSLAHRDMLINNDFVAGLTTDWGHCSTSTDPLLIPRFTPWDSDEIRFGIRLCRFFFVKKTSFIFNE